MSPIHDELTDTLIWAAKQGYERTVEVLVSAGATPTTEALYEALFAEHHGLVAKLIGYGADVNGMGGLPLSLCACTGDLVGAELLLKAGANPERGEPTPLLLAIREGHRVDLVSTLLAHGAIPSDEACHQARVYGETEMMNLLMAYRERKALDAIRSESSLKHETYVRRRL